GTFAVVCLLLFEPIKRLCDEIVKSSSGNETTSYMGFVPVCYAPDIVDVPTGGRVIDLETEKLIDIRPVVAFTLTFLVGIVQVAIGLFRLGSLTCYMAPSMVDGFVTGSAFHVLTSQISSLFGITRIARDNGIGSLFMVYVNFLKYIKETNLVTLAISSLSVAFLLTVKLLLEPMLKGCMRFQFPVPSELILEVLNNELGLLKQRTCYPGHSFFTLSSASIEIQCDSYRIYCKRCVLSAIIAVALKNILSHLCHIPTMWRTYKRDFFLFMITFLATLLLDITIGLIVGIIGCLLALTEQQRKPRLTVLYNVPGTEIFTRGTYKSPDNQPHLFKLDDCEQYNIIVCSLVGSLNFASAEQLSNDVFKVIRQEKERRSRMEKLVNNQPAADNIGPLQYTLDHEASLGSNTEFVTSAASKTSEPDDPLSVENQETMSQSTILLLELDGLSHVDPTGANGLQTLHSELIADHVMPIYVGGKYEFKHHKCLNLSTWAHPPLLDLTYPTLYDAYSACMDYVTRCCPQTMTLRTREEPVSNTMEPNC
ncbi:hypothetical protein EG68_04825, partial [Paragonimus skrjabini miyazakii]